MSMRRGWGGRWVRSSPEWPGQGGAGVAAPRSVCVGAQSGDQTGDQVNDTAGGQMGAI